MNVLTRPRALTALAAFGLLVLAAAGLSAQAPYKPQEPAAVLGTWQIDLFGPDGFHRVDGQDHDLDESLALFLPDAGRELAIFTDPRAWKVFFDEIYGDNPSDLALYAMITAAETDGPVERFDPVEVERCFSDLPEVEPGGDIRAESETTSRLLEPGQTARSPLALIEQGERFLTFKTDLGLLEEGAAAGRLAFKNRYTLFLSALLVGDRMLFLNVYGGDNGPSSEETLNQARAWRDAYLEKTADPKPAPALEAEPALEEAPAREEDADTASTPPAGFGSDTPGE